MRSRRCAPGPADSCSNRRLQRNCCTLSAAAQGDAVVAPSTTRRMISRFLPQMPSAHLSLPLHDPPPGLAELTVREREVLAKVGSGLSNTEIAALLHISEATVKTHVGHIMAKLGLRDRIQAVVYAYENGLIARNPLPG